MSDRSPRDIEREIEAERSALEHSIDQLQSQFSPELLVEQASTYLKANGSQMAETATRTVRENPMACALAGAGIAWLIAGATRSQGSDSAAAYDTRTRTTAQGFADPQPQMHGFDERVAAADRQMRAEAAPDPVITPDPSLAKETTDMSTYHPDTTLSHDTSDSWTDRAQTHARRVSAEAQSTAARLKAKITDGTSGMSEAARERVIRARHAAINAQAQVEHHAAQASRRARQTAQEQPLLIGALAFAAGAALAAALPRTETEDRTFGAQRDRLMDEADRIFREESAKLKSAASAAFEEGKEVAKDALSSDSETPSAADAVKRVSNAAKSEASVSKSVN